MGTVTAIQGVDDTLRALSVRALTGLKCDVTVGPLDREENQTRLNWFLYQLTPNPALANMEHPVDGWRTARGRPALALTLHYLLSAYSGHLTMGGDEDQFAHRALAATMQALHAHAVIAPGDAILSALAEPLVEPLRITVETLDLEALSKIWSAASKPFRLSVGYRVSLVVIDATTKHVAGPPVRERQVDVVPSLTPETLSVTPKRISAAADFAVTVSRPAGARFSLARRPGDPPGPPGGWPLTPVSIESRRVTLRLADRALVPGDRRLDMSRSSTSSGPPGASVGVTIVPVITAHSGKVTAGASVKLATAHAVRGVEVFLGGRQVDPAQVRVTSPAEVVITIPATIARGPVDAALRAATVPGPAYTGLVVA